MATLVQYKPGSGSGVSVGAAFDSSVTAGNKIIVVAFSLPEGVSTVSDTLGNTYTQRVADTYQPIEIWDATISSSGANTVTVTFDASTSYIRVAAMEWNGVGAWDTGAPCPSSIPTGTTGTDGYTTGQVTVSESSSLTVAAVAVANTNFSYCYAGTNFTELYDDTYWWQVEYRTSTPSGAGNATWTIDHVDDYWWVIGVWKPAADVWTSNARIIVEYHSDGT